MGGAEFQVLTPGNDSSNLRQDSTEHASMLSLVCSREIQLVTIAQAHSQAPSGVGRHLRYLSQVAQQLNFCRVLSCCQCLLQGHT